MGESATRVVLIVDLVGSTTWRVDHGDDLADQMLLRFERAFEDTTVAHGGRVVANRGDGFLSSFGSASGALAASAKFRQQFAELRLPVGPPLLRIGIAAGDVIERGREMYGLPVVEAARLESVAEPGEILCTDLVRGLTGTRAPVAFTDRRTMALKGLPEEVIVWTVGSEHPEPERTAGLYGLGGWCDDLPSSHDAFVGRDRDLEELESLVLENPIVTLTGPGGVGKTRLAIEVAHLVKREFVDGAWFVPLDSTRDLAEVCSTVGRNLRLPGSASDGGPQGLRSALGRLEGLVILDNCEQALDAVARLVHSLTGSGSRVRVLCTSREALGLRAERVRPLQPLSFPGDTDDLRATRDNDAVRLFVERARHRDPTRRFEDEELQHVARVVTRVEGLPLAIELAAARLNVMGVDEIADRADESFTLLAQGNPDRPNRHHTITAAVEWSVSLLSVAERRALARVAVFPAGATIDAIEAVCSRDSDVDVLDLVSGLVDKSLVRRLDDGRFSMLASVREAILERDESADCVAEARLLHLEYFEQLAHSSGRHVQHDPVALARFTREHDNFSAALSTALETSKTRALELAGRLALYWVLAGRAGEGDRRLAEILSAPGDVEPAVLANALRGAAMAAGLGARYPRSEELLVEARSIYEELQRAESVAYCDYWLARNAVVRTHFGLLDADHLDVAYERLSSAIAVFDAAGDDFGMLLAHPYLGWVRLLQGNFDEAERLSVELLELAHSHGADRLAAYARGHAAYVRLCIGDLEHVADDLDPALSVLESSGDTQNLVITLCVGTVLHLRRGDARAAVDSARRLVEHALSCDSSEWEALIYALAAHVLADQGDWFEAGVVVRTLELRHPNWRTPMRYMGIEPDDVLGHTMATDDPQNVLQSDTALTFIRGALARDQVGVA